MKMLGSYLKSQWQSFMIFLIGLYAILLAYLFSPSFVENYILPGKVLYEPLTQILHNVRFVAIGLGLFIILFGIVSAKWPTLFSRSAQQGGTGLFGYKNIFITISSFLIIFVSLHIIIKVFRRHIQFDVTPYWPLSNFLPQIPDWQHLFIAALILLIFYFFVRYSSRTKSRLIILIFFSIFLVMSTNLLQIQGWEGKNLLQNTGWETGFVVPITGSSKIGIQYYHDAIKISDAIEFISNFEHMQPDLLLHSRTHPPGPLLTIYLLLLIFGNPAIISIMIGVISVSLSIFFLYRILFDEFGEDLSKYATFLFVLIPSIQIFYVASIDALITSFLLGFLFFYLRQQPLISIIGSIFFLFLASFLSFTFVFVLPIMIGYEILVRKDILRPGYIILGLGLIYILIYYLLDYNYVNSFLIASALENQYGFMAISEPATYLFTRLEGICEIIFYFGPFLSLLMVLGLLARKRPRSDLLTLTWLAIFSFFAMLSVGAFRTGETARASMFIYPYLIIPVISYLHEFNISLKEKNVLLYLVFAQTILMQTFGFYSW